MSSGVKNGRSCSRPNQDFGKTEERLLNCNKAVLAVEPRAHREGQVLHIKSNQDPQKILCRITSGINAWELSMLIVLTQRELPLPR